MHLLGHWSRELAANRHGLTKNDQYCHLSEAITFEMQLILYSFIELHMPICGQ